MESQFPDMYRYNRQLILPEFGIEAQQKLLNAKLLVVGCGGLGSPVLLYLAAAGVGNITLIDADVVEISNLQRQILFDTNDVGKHKAAAAKQKLEALNPDCKITAHIGLLTVENVHDILSNVDLAIDCTDNFESRYALNDACVLQNKPWVYGSVYQFEGQVAVFNHEVNTVKIDYRDLWPFSPDPNSVPTCTEGGVLGVLPGMIGTLQANEAIKLITGIGSTFSGKLFTLNALNFDTQVWELPPNPKNPHRSGQDIPTIQASACQLALVPEIDAPSFYSWIEQAKPFQIIDVRTKEEVLRHAFENALHIPLANLANRLEDIPKNATLVFVCKAGQRSKKAAQITLDNGFKNAVFSLKGGIMGYYSAYFPTMIAEL